MDNLQEKAKFLVETLDLERMPVGVKFLAEEEFKQLDDANYDISGKYRYCQALMKAGYGEKVVLTKENITCPASAAAFGLKPLAEKLKNGDMLDKMGLFKSKEAARKTMDSIPRLELGRYQGVLLAPLSEINHKADVIVIESKVEDIMWLALASYYNEGGRLEFNSSIFQATCVDSTVVPFLSWDINTSLGCFGCREATDVTSGEALIGIPELKLDQVIENLELLSQQAIPRAKSKTAYQALTKNIDKKEGCESL